MHRLNQQFLEGEEKVKIAIDQTTNRALAAENEATSLRGQLVKAQENLSMQNDLKNSESQYLMQQLTEKDEQIGLLNRKLTIAEVDSNWKLLLGGRSGEDLGGAAAGVESGMVVTPLMAKQLPVFADNKENCYNQVVKSSPKRRPHQQQQQQQQQQKGGAKNGQQLSSPVPRITSNRG